MFPSIVREFAKIAKCLAVVNLLVFLLMISSYGVAAGNKSAGDYLVEGLSAYNLARGEEDYKVAAELFRKAADMGLDEAQNRLGVMYYSGKGVKQDYVEAAKWFRKSAEQGNAEAQNNLGFLYQNGHGVPKNIKEAEKWYKKAVEHGNENAKTNLANLYKPKAEESRLVGKREQERLAREESSSGNCSSCESQCSTYTALCKGGSQAGCYYAAACLCQCNLDAGGCGSSTSVLKQCVQDNNAKAASLKSDVPVFKPGHPPAVPKSKKSKPDSAAPRRPCSSGVVCAESATR